MTTSLRMTKLARISRAALHPHRETASRRDVIDSTLVDAGQQEESMSWATKLAKPYRVDHGKNFRLKDFDPGDTGHLQSKEHAQKLLEQGIASMAELQDKLYAQDCWGVLLIFQAMDAAGKDGAIKHVMSGVNPQGCEVHSFKVPSAEELDHDF